MAIKSYLVCKYEHFSGNVFRIEIQLRTLFQHAWATTVEIIDIIEQTNIKTHSHSLSEKNERQMQWEKLLSLMSRWIADYEEISPLFPQEKIDLSIKLNDINNQLHALKKLTTFKSVSERCVLDDSEDKEYALMC